MDNRFFLVDWDCCLGAGSEGEVFLGRSLATSELCAIKVSIFIDPEAAADQLELELDRCLRAAGEGVVRVIAWNLTPPRPFLVFEFAHAGSLGDEMSGLRAEGRVYHPVQALERAREVLAAMARVHDRGLIHRDIKPANLLRFDDAVKVIDFGSGFTADRPQPAKSGEIVGTRLYAAPEQLAGEPVDERADLYGAGCILHEMLTGQLPSRARGAKSALRYPNALILPELDALLTSLLQPRREGRPSSARAAIDMVDEVLAAYERARSVWAGLEIGASPY